MKLEFEAIGTKWNITFECAKSFEHQIALDIKKRISDFENTYSRFLPNSFTSQISDKVGDFILPADAKIMLDFYQQLYKLSDGAFTPLIGQNLIEAGYDKNYSLNPKTLHTIQSWDNSLEYNFPHLKIKKKSQFDFGGLGKGYLIDIIGDLLKQNNISTFVIDAGSDMLFSGEKTFTIGLEDPNNKDQVIGQIKISNGSLCASSGSRRKWNKFHHIIDPRTLESPQQIIATWVIAENAIVADGLATCLFLVDPEDLSLKDTNQYYKYDYLILYQDYSVKKSDAFNCELFNDT